MNFSDPSLLNQVERNHSSRIEERLTNSTVIIYMEDFKTIALGT